MWQMAAGIGSQLGSDLLQATTSAYGAHKQMEFQKNMYKHRYQWTVQDMMKAGINPIYAAQMGLGGGNVPAGAAASPRFGSGDISDLLLKGPKLKAELRLTNAQAAAQETSREHIAAQIGAVQSQIRNFAAEFGAIRAREARENATATWVTQQAKKTAAETEAVEAENILRRLLADFYDSPEGRAAFKYDQLIDRLNKLQGWFHLGAGRGARSKDKLFPNLEPFEGHRYVPRR